MGEMDAVLVVRIKMIFSVLNLKETSNKLLNI